MLNKKIMAAAICVALMTVSFSSCGKEVELESETTSNTSQSSDESSNSKESDSSAKEQSSSSVEQSNGDIMNFTAPQEGEQIVIMKIKDMGEIKIKLFPDLCPKGVENFVELAKTGYYDELIFHRVIKDFMIQGGDPKGNGTGGESIWGGSFDGGVSDGLGHFSGAVAYANSGSTATDGSQFYIVTGQTYKSSDLTALTANYGMEFSDAASDLYQNVGGTPWLDGSYTIFGQVFDGLDIVYEIQNVSTDSSDKPYDAVVIESVTVGEYDGGDVKWYISDYNAD